MGVDATGRMEGGGVDATGRKGRSWRMRRRRGRCGCNQRKGGGGLG